MPSTVSKGVNTADEAPAFAQLTPGGEKTMSNETSCDDHLQKGALGVCTRAGSFQEKNCSRLCIQLKDSSNPTHVCSHRRNLGSKYGYGSGGALEKNEGPVEEWRRNTNKAYDTFVCMSMSRRNRDVQLILSNKTTCKQQ